MRVYSVSEAIGPAWERTQLVLRTGRWGTNFKVASVVVLAEMGSLLFLPVHAGTLLSGPRGAGLPSSALHVMAVFVALTALVGTAIYAALFYFGSRMQLTFLDMVLTRSHIVAPLWARHRQSTWRWMGLKLLPSALFLVGLVPFVAAFSRFQRASFPQPGVDPQVAAQAQVAAMHHAFAGLFAVSAVYVLLAGLSLLLYSHLRDFVLPYLAIDQLSVTDALNRWISLWRTYPGQMLGYVFFRLLLLVGTVIVFYIALFLAIGIPAVLAVLLGFGIKLAIHGAAGTALLIAYILLVAFAGIAWYLLVLLFAGATFATFFQCYALYFLGGRDPRIGALLEPETAIPVWTPPPSIPRDEDSSGPDFPADPALA